MTYLPREMIHPIVRALADMPVVAVTGMRQTRKSTFLRQQAELQGRRYVTLDDFSQLAATVAGYLSAMEVSCVSFRLAPYLKNPASRLIKSPKFYLGDSGLAAFLAGLKAFVASTPHCAAGILAYNGTTPVPLGPRLWAIPLGLLLS